MRLFNRITLQTPESVELEFTLAGIGSRVLAYTIDFVLWLLILLIFVWAWTFLSFQVQDYWERFVGDGDTLALWLISIFFLLFFALYVGYFVFFETLWCGQTPGKRFIKIRVIRDDGRPVRLPQATLRALLRPIDDLFPFFPGVFLIAFGGREKRLGDWVAGTVVVQEERPVVAANFPISESAKHLASQLPFEADLSQLQPEDFAVIREYLQRRQTMLSEARAEKGRQLAHQVKELIALPGVPKDTTAHQFLEAVYLAYQQQSPGG